VADKKKAPRTVRKRTDAQVITLGLAAHELASTHRARIEPRLPPGALDALLAKVTLLRSARPTAILAITDKTASTVAQDHASEGAHAIVVAIRDALVSAKLDVATKKAWGVGTPIRSTSVPHVVAAGQRILARAATHPDEALAAGVLPRDLEALRVAIEALVVADTTQDGKKVSVKAVVAARNAATRAVEEAASRISALGRLEFVNEPPIAGRFAALTERTTPTDEGPGES
jgi:hypothetical protein